MVLRQCVRIDSLFQRQEPARVGGAIVTFEPGARTAWHTHPLGQTLIVTSGVGRRSVKGSCMFCEEGLPTACVHRGFFGDGTGLDGAQAEALRIPYADGTLFPLAVGEDDALMPSPLTLSDVMGTGHHAAVTAKVAPGHKVAVVGDGAVGLCG